MFDSSIKTELACFANDVDALNPQIWANESLVVLYNNLVAAQLVHRDFSPLLANYGDTVNTRYPGTLKMRRKTNADNVDTQDVSLTNVQVKLDQWGHVSFVIKDGEETKSMKSLFSEFLVPSVQGMAQGIDQCVLATAYQFLANRVGGLGLLTSSTAKTYLLAMDNKMNELKIPVGGRQVVWASASQAALKATDLFVAANQRGDGGRALDTAQIGHLLGFDNYMDQNTPGCSILGTLDTAAGTLTTGVAAGTTGSQACTFSTHEVVDGTWVTIAGEMVPHEVTDHTFSTNTTAITLDKATEAATSNGAVITAYNTVTVNQAVSPTGYAAGYAKWIVLDGFTSGKFLQVGQMLSFGTGANRKNYMVIDVKDQATTNQTVLLDRPLEAAIADGDLGFPGPAGSYNLGFIRNAIALVSRPLALPPDGVGARSATASYGGIGLRTVMTYDGLAQGTRVTIDLLFGTKVLNPDMGVVLLG